MAIQDDIKAHNESKRVLVDKFSKYLTDTTIPLEQRWDDFVEYGEILPHEAAWGGNVKIEILNRNLCLYDNFYIDRHQVGVYAHMWQRLHELEYDDSNLISKYNIPQEKLDEWREAVLKSGYYSFVYDW